MTINKVEGAPQIVYPKLADNKLRKRIQKQIAEQGLDKPGPERQVIQVVVIQEEPTKKKKKGKLRRCGKFLVCLPVVMFCCCSKFMLKRLFKCMCSPCRCVGNCLCPCC